MGYLRNRRGYQRVTIHMKAKGLYECKLIFTLSKLLAKKSCFRHTRNKVPSLSLDLSTETVIDKSNTPFT